MGRLSGMKGCGWPRMRRCIIADAQYHSDEAGWAILSCVALFHFFSSPFPPSLPPSLKTPPPMAANLRRHHAPLLGAVCGSQGAPRGQGWTPSVPEHESAACREGGRVGGREGGREGGRPPNRRNTQIYPSLPPLPSSLPPYLPIRQPTQGADSLEKVIVFYLELAERRMGEARKKADVASISAASATITDLENDLVGREGGREAASWC